ncbi:MAG: hypothetical protein ACOVQ4_14825 [Flectobacillus sp.]|uniref:hypothetical protein n=1 Tax=Flectobacillus sp. TaxID=50419 RepID=UPI003B9C6695
MDIEGSLSIFENQYLLLSTTSYMLYLQSKLPDGLEKIMTFVFFGMILLGLYFAMKKFNKDH